MRTTNLINAKNLWLQSNQGRPYSFDVVRRCFCSLGGVPVRVIVKGDEVVRIAHQMDTIFSKEPNPYGHRTIPEHFSLILELIEQELNSDLELTVTYDPQFGYPTEIAWKFPDKIDSAVKILIAGYEPM